MKKNYMGIEIDLERDNKFDKLGLLRMQESYMRADEGSPQERYAFVSKAFASDDAHAQRLYDYASMHWLSYATPILSFGRTKNGLPISCFLSYVDDSAEGLVDTLSETNWLSMLGGGVGVRFGIRSASEKSTGVLPHLKIYDASSLAFRQGSTRRGSYAAYLRIDHPDIMAFLEIRKPTGDQNIRCLNLHHGILITDKFMNLIEKSMLDENFDDSFELVDPDSTVIKEVVSARMLWQKILELRITTGEPYLLFIDTANKGLPQWQKNLGLKIQQSNLCTEIILATSKERTAVCCLSSLNVELYDEWRDHPQFLHDVLEMLDNVLTYFIEHAPDTIARAKFSAMRERSVGVGVLGFHAWLQKNNFPFESALAKSANMQIFSHIRGGLDIANKKLAVLRGEAPDAVGWGVRLSHVMAPAPNASTSIIVGNTSPSTEPFKANAYRQDTLSGSHTAKNKFLDRLLLQKCAADKGLDYDELWSSIMSHSGSVQHLDCLDDWEKSIYKTAIEIDQRWIIEHAADRQQFIDQAQSVNLFFKPDVSIKYLHATHFMAWKRKLKTLYYCRSEKILSADKISEKIERSKIEEVDMSSLLNEDECLACSG